jgi:predicted alpha/beta-hydrolase family hydrolase
LRTPTLFISGTKDSFGTIAEVTTAIDLIPGRTELVPIEGASHGLSKAGATSGIARIVTRRFLDFVSS